MNADDPSVETLADAADAIDAVLTVAGPVLEDDEIDALEDARSVVRGEADDIPIAPDGGTIQTIPNQIREAIHHSSSGQTLSLPELGKRTGLNSKEVYRAVEQNDDLEYSPAKGKVRLVEGDA